MPSSSSWAVVGIGARPSTELAAAAGIACDRGVLVDEMLRTSTPGVWAAGDVARWPDPRGGERVRIEHWVLAERLGQVAARNILGAKAPFRAVPFFWSRHYDVSIQYVGSAFGFEVAESVGDPRHGKGAVSFKRRGQTIAVASVGDARVSLEAELALESGEPAAVVEWERRLRAANPKPLHRASVHDGWPDPEQEKARSPDSALRAPSPVGLDGRA